MALTNVQNEFLKLQLANNPEFKANYFPNVLTEGPVGPLHYVDPHMTQHDPNIYFQGFGEPKLPTLTSEEMAKGPKQESEKYYEGRHPELRRMDERRMASQFKDIPVPYDTPGSRINIRNVDQYGKWRGEEVSDIAHIIPAFTTSDEGKPISAGQTSAIYLNPNIEASYGTKTTSPRNEMVNTPDWWTDFVEPDVGPHSPPPTVDQADINAYVTGVLGHEVGHGANLGIEPYVGITKEARDVNRQNIFPMMLSEEAQAAIQAPAKKHGNLTGIRDPETGILEVVHTNPYLSDQDELYNRATDIERIKMMYPKNYETQFMWKHYQKRAREKFNESMGRFEKVPKRFRPNYETYHEYVKPSILNYLQTVKEAGSGFQPHRGDVGGGDLSPGGGYGQSPTGSDIAGTPFSRGGILGAF